ncbi:S-layer homology domain-containing protein [Actinomarinicola tropica]|uniref:SLH domain-containing protein n=1 Tax=Actinomarinicola tropica TaxID=2789776 RepID=A0A5Q2RRP0_9ACTN|nr:S-layer homology domain-containing protein [Actinomarinicola tropica]QGG95855.1 hypothetical protein GH723_12520 [Actinomarinicola tropica]
MSFRRSLAAAALAVATLCGVVVAAPTPAGASAGELEITGGGWGHGIGMSQYGAKGMADAGASYQDILRHYYRDVSIANPPSLPAYFHDVRVRLTQTAGTTVVRLHGSGTRVHHPAGSHVAPANAEIRVGYSGGTMLVKIDGVTRYEGAPGAVVVELRGGRHASLPELLGARQYKWGDLAILPTSRFANTGCSARTCVGVQNLSMNQYLYGLAEIPSSWDADALKAQVVAARSFAAATIRDRGDRPFHLDPGVADQVYAGYDKEGGAYGDRWVAAVDATQNQVVYSGSTIATTWYSSSSGGHTADSGYVFENQVQVPWAYGVPDPGDATPSNPNHRWVRTYTLDEIGSWFGLSGVRDVRLGGNIGVGGRTNRATVWIDHAGGTREMTAHQFRTTVNARAGGSRQIISSKWAITRSGFSDVAPGAFYAGAVEWAVEHEITTGVGSTGRFEPNRAVTRGELATFLYRFVDASPPSGGTSFPDVDPSAFYGTAVQWLSAEGITGGVGNSGLFEPNRAVTRGELATFLHRLAREPAAQPPTLFPDVPRTAFYARPVGWLLDLGLTTGVGDTGLYKPDAAVTRGELVTFLHRMAETPAAWTRWSPPPEIAQ